MRQITTPDDIPERMRVILERLDRNINKQPDTPKGLFCSVISAKDNELSMSLYCDDAPKDMPISKWIDEVCVAKAAEGADFVCGIANVLAGMVDPPNGEVLAQGRAGHVEGVARLPDGLEEENMREAMIVYFHTPTKEYVACGFIKDDVIVSWIVREADVMTGCTTGIMSSIYPRAMAQVNVN